MDLLNLGNTRIAVFESDTCLTFSVHGPWDRTAMRTALTILHAQNRPAQTPKAMLLRAEGARWLGTRDYSSIAYCTPSREWVRTPVAVIVRGEELAWWRHYAFEQAASCARVIGAFTEVESAMGWLGERSKTLWTLAEKPPQAAIQKL
jgi:hypothetical protein